MKTIHELLNCLGVSRTYKGFNFTACAVKFVVAEPEKLIGVTKGLYWDVAKACSTSDKCVERNIRTVVRVAWKKNPELLTTLAGYPLDKAPAAPEFIDILARAVVRRKGSVWH